jgi:hypothetical protein
MSLTLRLFIVNFAGACAFIWACSVGLVKLVTDADAVHMPTIVAGVFLCGLASAFWQARKVGRATAPKAIKRVRITSAHLSTLVFVLFSSGIIGTGLSLLTGFHGITFGTTPEQAQSFGAQIISGVSSCFGATVTGAVAGVWVEINARMINTSISLLELDAE